MKILQEASSAFLSRRLYVLLLLLPFRYTFDSSDNLAFLELSFFSFLYLASFMFYNASHIATLSALTRQRIAEKHREWNKEHYL